jgi:hypothetical protein
MYDIEINLYFHKYSVFRTDSTSEIDLQAVVGFGGWLCVIYFGRFK